jgi:hypothetical protein
MIHYFYSFVTNKQTNQPTRIITQAMTAYVAVSHHLGLAVYMGCVVDKMGLEQVSFEVLCFSRFSIFAAMSHTVISIICHRV